MRPSCLRLAFLPLALLMAAGAAAAAPPDRTGISAAPPPAGQAVKPDAGAATGGPPAAGTTPPRGTLAPAPGEPVEVLGFRSAHFGMTDKDVRAAITKDFGKDVADKATEQTNDAERTEVVSVLVPDLFEGAGKASVSYVFGYASKKLIQVAVLWSPQTDSALTPERIFADGKVLQAYLQSGGYKADTVVTNVPMDSGLILFRANDKADRTTMLLLQGSMAPGEGQQRVLTPRALILYYIADAKNPDIFRLPPGQF